MRKIAVLIAVLGTTLLPVLCTVPAHAQATRTWVSGVGERRQSVQPNGSVPDLRRRHYEDGGRRRDRRAGPRRLWRGDHHQVDHHRRRRRRVASVMASSDTIGITVSAGATDIVTIRNVQVQGDLGNGSSPSTAGDDRHSVQFRRDAYHRQLQD